MSYSPIYTNNIIINGVKSEICTNTIKVLSNHYIIDKKRLFHSTNIANKHHENLEFKIYRWNPEKPKEKPKYQTYKVETEKVKPTVLDSLLYIKENEDPTLTFRHQCHHGKCGACAMNINGVNSLACTTMLDDKIKTQTISPLPNIPVVKDLVLDLTHYYKQYKGIQPWLLPKNDKEKEKEKDYDKEELQTEKQRKKLDGYYECNLCACCSASCPNYWRDSDAYLGPSTILNSYRWIRDSRDGFHSQRKDSLQGPDSIFRCHGEMNCMSNCPQGLNPAKAIAKLKLSITKEG